MPINFETKTNQENIEKIFALMEDGLLTSKELIEETGFRSATVMAYLRYLMDIEKVYVSSYRFQDGYHERIYAIGNRPSVNKASFLKNKKNFNPYIKKTTPKPDKAASWLFNPC